ncbi:hypothetical protein FLACOL_01102 [Flavobacterium columnare]|uniref:Uncharacterized protein n=2 Tax=Flavobacterium TaxID=237 RepID=A0A246GEV0_9FLAO|nr:hypothetical protein BWK59_14770 [Flavobacterium davisii]SPE77112.1 hypothetical protein FLACOL_01102 [Flavobacterium columnare]
MNDYEKLTLLFYEYQKQFDLSEITKEEYNKKLDEIFVQLKKLDFKNSNNAFNDFVFKTK